MRPDLAADDRPAGPQILDGGSGARASGPFDDGATAVSYANYRGKLPDYVLGTDAKRFQTWSWAEPAPRQAGRRRHPDDDMPPAPTEELASAAIGGDAYDAVVADKTPVAWPADIEDEAPPEASGDTRAAN